MQRIGRSLLFGEITPNVPEGRRFITTPSLTPHLTNSSNGQSCVAWDLCAAPTLGFGSLGQLRQESAELMGLVNGRFHFESGLKDERCFRSTCVRCPSVRASPDECPAGRTRRSALPRGWLWLRGEQFARSQSLNTLCQMACLPVRRICHRPGNRGRDKLPGRTPLSRSPRAPVPSSLKIRRTVPGSTRGFFRVPPTGITSP